MNRKILCLTTCLSWIFLSSCDRETQNSSLLVGTYRVIDQNIPYPFLLEKVEDSILLIDHKNKVIDRGPSGKTNFKAGDTLEMKDHSFFFLSDNSEYFVFDLRDSLNFSFAHYKAGAKFRRVKVEDLISLEEVKGRLVQQPYVAEIISATPNRDLDIQKAWWFSQDSLTTVYSYFYEGQLMYQENQTKGYFLFKRNKSYFFSENEAPENPQMLYQITDFNNNNFKIRYYRNEERIEEVYEMAEGEELPADLPEYYKCLDGQPGEYYHDNITYRKGNDYLIRKIRKNAPVAEGDGYITLHFTLNCRGEVGRLGLEQMDLDYNSTSFSPALIKHLVSEVTDLTDWPEIPSSYFYKDVHAFLMFKMEDGIITDLLP